MKYIRTYETEEKFLTDKDSTSRGFRLKPTLYKYSEAGDHVQLELDDPRKYKNEGSTYMEITLDSDVEFSFYIGNAPDNTETTMDCRVDWGDGTVDKSLSITADDKGFKLVHNYTAGSYSIELHKMARDYSIIGDATGYKSLISHPSSVKRVILGEGNSRGVGGVTSIGEEAFSECSSITSVHIPSSVSSIDYDAFYNCTSLTSVNIPEGITIGDCVFQCCSSLKSIYIPNSVNIIGEYAFSENPSLISIHIPEGVTTIGNSTLYGCTSLTSVYIPEGVTTIEDGVFKNCTSLTSVYIPEGVTTIGSTTYDGVFENCSSLTSVYIPRSVTSIGRNAFKDCSSLTSIDLPEGVTTIDDGTFNHCTSLSSISFHSTTVPFINGSVFDIYLPDSGILHIKPGATGYDELLGGWFPPNWRIVEDL